MRSFFEWATENQVMDQPWLVLGKGPSFSKKDQFVHDYKLLGLNHVARDQFVDVAHIIDLDVVDQLGEVLMEQCGIVVMPWIPHIKNRAGRQNLQQITAVNPILQALDRQQRLFYYNLHSGRERQGDSPVVFARFFSAEAAIRLLAMAGVGTIRTLGIDGGTTYSADFKDLENKTLLANGLSSFNKQFKEFAKIIMENDLDLAPADMPSPIKVYVATQEEQMLAVKVLEYSIRKHASMSVEVIPIHRTEIATPLPKDEKNHPRTPFSFQRFLIPEMAGYQGRAIYLDSDMQVFKDIKDLWTLPFNGAQLLAVKEPGSSGRRPQFSVMLLDCEALKWRIGDIVSSLDKGELDYEALMYDMSVAETISADIDPIWNSLERYQDGETALVHYTDMTTQPWVCSTNPLGYLWVRDLMEAVANGFISYDYIKEHTKKGYIRPSLLYQLDHGLEDGLLLPKAARQMDRNYRAPFTAIHRHGAAPWQNKKAWLKALVRHFLLKTRIAALWRKIDNVLHLYD
jgi:hypothetical protein